MVLEQLTCTIPDIPIITITIKNKLMKKKQLTVEDYLFIIGLILLIVCLPFALFYVSIMDKGIFPPCMLYTALGLYCPGCGGSRAVKSLFQGDIISSLIYHPLVPYTVIVYMIFMLSQALRIISHGKIKGIKFYDWFLYVAVAIIVVNWILKNVLKLVWNISM